MPTYIYAIKDLDPEKGVVGCDHCRNGFEIVQKMSEEALSECPECGGAIQRVITPPMLGNVGNKLKGPSSGDIEKAGFTQYKRVGKGQYEKSFGKEGPSRLGE